MKKRDKSSNKPLIGTIIAAALVLLAPLMVHKHGDDDRYFRERSVKLYNGQGMCSGEQIHAPSGKDYILSAGHCHVLADSDGSISVETEDGNKLKRKVIAEDENSDLLLIEGLPNLKGLTIGKDTHRGQFIRTFTRGGDLVTHETDGVALQRLEAKIALRAVASEDDASCSQPKNKIVDAGFFGRLCIIDVEEIVVTANIIPGSSGGMVVNSIGELIGVCSAASPYFGLMVRLEDIQSFIKGY